MLWASYLKRMKSYLFAIILLQKKVRFLGMEEQVIEMGISLQAVSMVRNDSRLGGR